MLRVLGGIVAILASAMSLFLLFALLREADSKARLTGAFAVVLFGLVPLSIGAGLFLLGGKLRGPRISRGRSPRPSDRVLGQVLLLTGAIFAWIGVHDAILILGVGDPKGEVGIAVDALVGLAIVPCLIGLGLILPGWHLRRRWRSAQPTADPPITGGTVPLIVGGTIAAPMAFITLCGVADTFTHIGPENPLLLGVLLHAWYRPIVWFLLAIGLELVGVGLYRRQRRKSYRGSDVAPIRN